MEFYRNFIVQLEEQPLELEKDIDKNIFINNPPTCPVCEEYLFISGRCKTCYSCGWSSCDL